MTNGPLVQLLCFFIWFATACNVFTMPLTASWARVSIWAGMLAGQAFDRIWWENFFDIHMLMSLSLAKSRSYSLVTIKEFDIPSSSVLLKHTQGRQIIIKCGLKLFFWAINTNFMKLIMLNFFWVCQRGVESTQGNFLFFLWYCCVEWYYCIL